MSKGKRSLNGYILIYEPEHPSAMKNENWLCYVYEHRIVAEKIMGRALFEWEDVHHLDLNKSNNCPSNLIVLEKSQHAKLHVWINNNRDILDAIMKNKDDLNTRYCKCGNFLYKHQKKFCSLSCAKRSKINEKRPSREQLIEDLSSMSYVSVGKKYGVSDNAIRKWLKSN